jgi:hypothetical protein
MWSHVRAFLEALIAPALPATPDEFLTFMFAVTVLVMLASLLATRVRRKAWFSQEEFVASAREGFTLAVAIPLFFAPVVPQALQAVSQTAPFFTLAGTVLIWSAVNKLNAITRP